MTDTPDRLDAIKARLSTADGARISLETGQTSTGQPWRKSTCNSTQTQIDALFGLPAECVWLIAEVERLRCVAKAARKALKEEKRAHVRSLNIPRKAWPAPARG